MSSLGFAISWALERNPVAHAPKEQPKSEAEILALSDKYRREGLYSLSRKVLRKAIQTDLSQRRTVYYADLGITEAAAGFFADAIQAQRKSLEVMPGYKPAQYRLACLLAHVGELEEANLIFSRNLSVILGNGGTTTTATVRFASQQRRT